MKVERPDRGAGFRRPVGRACGLFRLQKSTSGAWQSAPGRDERAEAALSSPSSLGSVGRKSVGSRTEAAKSRDRWRVRVRGRLAQAGLVERAFVDGRRLGSLGIVDFERVGGEGGPGGACRASAHAHRDMGVRGRFVRPVRGRQRRGRGVSPVGSISIGSPAGSGGIRAHRIGGRVQRKVGRSSWRVVKHVVTRVVRWGSSPSDVVNHAQAGWPPRESMDPSGARVVSRLQKSARSIFPAHRVGAARRSGRAG
jgi:hypothetical protein